MPRKIALAAIALLIAVALIVAFVVRSRLTNDRIKATIEAQASSALGEPVQIGTIDVRWFPRPGLTLGRVAVGAKDTLLIDRLVLSTGLRPLLSGHIAEADVLIERSRLDAPRFFAVLTAPPARPPTDNRPSAVLPLTIDAIRSIALRGVALMSGRRTIEVDGDLAYSARGLEIRQLAARSDATELTASGAITDLQRRAGHLTITARKLDLDGLIEFMAPFGSSPAAPSATPPHPFDLTVEISAAAGHAIGAAFSNLSAACRATNGRVTLEPLRFALFGGHVDGAVAVRTNAAVPQYEWRGAVSGVDVAKLVEFAGASNTITGTLDARGSLRGSGGSVHEAFTNASGSTRAVIRNGRVPGLELVRTVILAFGRPAGERPAGSGEQFTELAADLSVGGGRASTRNLTFASRDVDMRGAGRIDLRTQAIDLDVDLVLSQELSAQAGRDLYRYASEGERIVLPARITGTAAHPAVMLNLEEALMRAAKNKLKERAKSLLDRIIR